MYLSGFAFGSLLPVMLLGLLYIGHLLYVLVCCIRRYVFYTRSVFETFDSCAKTVVRCNTLIIVSLHCMKYILAMFY